jgi:transposase
VSIPFRRLTVCSTTGAAGRAAPVVSPPCHAEKPLPKRAAKTTKALPGLNPNAAGADIGATEIFVAVPEDRDERPVRCVTTCTQDLHALADWLQACGIQTIALESTGVYWIPLFPILEGRGIDVCLVTSRHVKNVPGRKSDVADCQWLPYLHAVGLLRASCRPPQAVCAVRSLLRHRARLVTYAAAHLQPMQKALTQMNLPLHHVIRDLTGKTGLALLDAIRAGERDPNTLAQLRDFRIKASAATIATALVGAWRDEQLLTLRQALAASRHDQQLITDGDHEIAGRLGQCASQGAPAKAPLLPPTPTHRKPQRNAIRCAHTDLRTALYRILGVDLTQVPGLQTTTLHTLFTELGRELSAFPTAKHFASWLGLGPDNRVSGGRVLSAKTRNVRSRAADALRLAAHSLHHRKSALGEFYRRMRARLGAPKAITTTAHKRARILYHLLTTGHAYDETVFAQDEERYRHRRVQRLHREAAALGSTLAPKASVS